VSRTSKNLIKPLQTRGGFTLIEMIVVIGVTGLIMLMISEIFLNIIQSSVNATVTNDVRENGQYMMETIVRAVRNADSVTGSGITNSITVVTSGISVNGVTTNSVSTDFVFSSSTVQGCSSGLGCLLKNNSPLNSSNIIVETGNNCTNPSVVGCSYFDVTQAVGNNPPKVKIVLVLRTANPGGFHTEYVTNQVLTQRVVEIRRYQK
jgi:prepilin-type N-terminal cleavage/methylation domain-containing protein